MSIPPGTPSAGTPDPVLRAFLIARGLARDQDEVRWTALAGGVSSDIWRVDVPPRTFCIKRALGRLKVAQNWEAPVARNAFEWRWLCFASQHDSRIVPQPIAHDPSLGVFAMAYLDPSRYPVWKEQLMRGVADAAFAARVGESLVAVHAASARRSDVAETFATDDIFWAIRLDPYLGTTAAKHPDLAAALNGLASRTASHKCALVHGDVSPKNILVGADGPVFLDAECAWYGDPAFDVAFCLNHLLLKCMVRRDRIDAYLACFASFVERYLANVTWEARDAFDRRAATLLPGLLLARVDGKSPVEYLTRDAERAFVRATARAWIERPPGALIALAERWRDGLTRYRDPA